MKTNKSKRREKNVSRMQSPGIVAEACELPPLKRWTREGTTERDWDFADFCQALEHAASAMPESESPFLIARAFAWELDRELGSGHGPFDLAEELGKGRFPVISAGDCQLTLMRQNAPTVAVSLDPPLWVFKPRKKSQPLNAWHLGELGHHVTPDTYGASRGTYDICALEIPWSDHEDEVVEAFRLWLRQHRGATTKGKNKPGRKHEWRTWFSNLAIYRLAASGYSRAEVLKGLQGNYSGRFCSLGQEGVAIEGQSEIFEHR